MAESPAHPIPGDHQITENFGSADATSLASTEPLRKRRPQLIRVVFWILVIGIVCGAVQLTANLLFDDAQRGFESTAADAEKSRSLLADDVSTFDDAIAAGNRVVESASIWLMDADMKSALASAVSAAEPTAEQIASVAERPIPTGSDKPRWAWELFGATVQLNADRDTADDLIASYDSANEDAVAAASTLEEAGSTALHSAANAAQAFEAAHIAARNPDIIAFRAAAERVSIAAETLDSTASTAYSDFEAAAAQMLASEHDELMEKGGPLNSARDEVEAFARSLVPGLLLDFDWSPLVNGFGDADSMGGYATWWYGEPGYANIELSNSVAEYWPSDRSKALVAHEVGHAVSVRCDGAYDDSSQDKIEDWATAWAISMGFLNRANGTSTYGAPPQALIDAAAGCR